MAWRGFWTKCPGTAARIKQATDVIKQREERGFDIDRERPIYALPGEKDGLSNIRRPVKLCRYTIRKSFSDLPAASARAMGFGVRP